MISGGEYSEDDVNELVKEDEVDGEEQTQKTKGKKRKAQSVQHPIYILCFLLCIHIYDKAQFINYLQ